MAQQPFSSDSGFSTTGNITGGYILGNGSQLTGVAASYNDSNVATFLAAYGSNAISTTGNVTAGNIIGNINPTSNINGTTANVTLVAGAYNWNFDNTGNLTLPANTFSVNYANGTIVTLGGDYGNANVVANLAALGSNPVSTTGNVSAGNIIVSGTANTGVYALDVGATATFLSNTVSSFTANVNNYTQLTLQNLNSGADATADYILTANNGNDTVNYSDFGIINSGYDNSTPTNSLGNIVFAADTYLYAQGNTGNTSQAGGNLAIGTTTAGKSVKIFAGGVTNGAIVATISNTGVAVTGTVSATGNITTAGNFVGNGAALSNVTVSVAGNIVGTQPNVSLVAGSYTMTFDNTGLLTLPTMGGDEGGEINLGIPATNTTLQNRVAIDVFQDRLRFFEGSANAKGAYIDLAQSTAGVGTLLNNRVSGLVNAGTFVTMDLIKATVTTSSNRGLSLATTTGTLAYSIGGTYGMATPATGGSAGTGTLTTTPTASIFNWGFTSTGDTATYILTDTTNSRAYRITLMIGASFNNNMISIERLI